MEPFKNFLHEGLVRQAAAHLARQAQRLHLRFDAEAFAAEAAQGLAALELKARAMHIAGALEHHLPADFAAAATLIEAALAPPAETEEAGQMPRGDAGLAGWILWPVGEFIARRGIGDPERALAALHALTQRFSGEFAIRPFIAAHPQLVFAVLARWVHDPSVHVRRLASEGSRPRLPWGMRLESLVADPSPTLPLLRALQDDASAYVRRSVANHLNDIAKDHPALVTAWVREHLPHATPERRALLRHASRTLIKRGDAAMLAVWGLGRPFKGEAALRLTPARVALGGAVQLTLALRSGAARAQPLAIDIVVHHVKANGGTSPKVFKGWQLTLAPREARTLTKNQPMRPVTTRTHYAGRHRVVVQINGRPAAEAAFSLRV
ncbi:MAG: DNA alkylation repair protein [Rubrivivax sp.]